MYFERLRIFVSFIKANRDLPVLSNLQRARRMTQLAEYCRIERAKQLQEWLKNTNPLKLVREIAIKNSQVIKQRIDLLISESRKEYEKNPQQINQRAYGWLVKHLGNYYKGIQNILEGKREVLTNPQFKLHDGKTVQEKQEEAEAKIKFLLGKFTKK